MTRDEFNRAIEELMRALRAPLIRHAAGCGALDAEAAVADAFLALRQEVLSQLPSIDAARGWLYSTVRNKARTQCRAHKRERTAVERNRSNSETAPSAEQEAMQNLNEEDVLKWIEQLTDRQRDVVELRIIHDYSVKMIAAKLGIAEGAVKCHLFRAYKKLRKGRGRQR